MDWILLRNSLRELDVDLFTLGGVDFTVSSLLKLIVVLYALFWLAARLRDWTEARILSRTHLDPGSRRAVGAIVRYLVLIIGLTVVLQNIGVNLAAFSVVAGAVGVGVGFGLQNIVSNFISGLIIMMERPIKIGDRVEIGGLEATVRDIGARKTIVVTNDNIALLVPNQRFILDNVTNLVYTEKPIRLRIAMGVAPGTDAEVMKGILLGVARSHTDVLATPEPTVLLNSLGGSAMQFELAVWYEPRGPVRQRLTSELNFLIEVRLREHEIRTVA